MNHVVSFRPEMKFVNRERCIDLINIPLFKIVAMEVELKKIPHDSALVFMSQTAFRIFLEKYGRDYSSSPSFAIGKITADLMLESGFSPIVPRIHDSMALAEEIANHLPVDMKIYIPSNLDHETILDTILEKTGYHVTRMYLYRYEKLNEMEEIGRAVSNEGFSGFVFTSPMEVKYFHSVSEGRYMQNKVHAIGRTTENELLEMGYTNIGAIGNGNFEKLVEIICKNIEDSGEWI